MTWAEVRACDQRAAIVGLVALIGIGLLLETTLLAGPAFAVSAARQRRSLALIASNGAERAQLRRYVLGQALLLGGLAALLGVPLGLAGGAGLIGLERRIEPSASVGPFDPPWIWLAASCWCRAVQRGGRTAAGARRGQDQDRRRARRPGAESASAGPDAPAGVLLMLAAAGMLVARLLVWPNTDSARSTCWRRSFGIGRTADGRLPAGCPRRLVGRLRLPSGCRCATPRGSAVVPVGDRGGHGHGRDHDHPRGGQRQR